MKKYASQIYESNRFILSSHFAKLFCSFYVCFIIITIIIIIIIFININNINFPVGMELRVYLA